MARIAGVDIPREKRLEISPHLHLRHRPHHGRSRSARPPTSTATPGSATSPTRRSNRIRACIDQNLKVEGDLRREVQQDIKRKMEIGCYQGLRHRRGLPVRGQRTQTNARTRKGPKKTVAGKKKVAQVMAKPARAAAGPARRSARTSPTASRTSRARSTTRSSRSPTRRATSSPWASAGNVGFKGSRKSTPYAAQMAAEQAARRAMEHGVRKVDVQVKGPGLRPRDRHPLDPEHRHRGHRHQGRHPCAPQRLPPAQAARVGGSEHGSLHRSQGQDLAPPGRQHLREPRARRIALDKRPYPPGEHGRTRRRAAVRVPRCSCRRSRRPSSSTACSSASSATSTRRPTASQGVTGENLLRFLELRLDNVVFRAGWAATRPAGPPVREPRPRQRQRPAGSTSPATGSRKGDVVSLRDKAREHDRHPATTSTSSTAQPRPGSRPATAASRHRARAARSASRSTCPVREQLIVELYSQVGVRRSGRPRRRRTPIRTEPR